MFDLSVETVRRKDVCWAKSLSATFSSFPTVAAPDLLDPKSVTHNTKPRLSFSTKPITLTPREENEVRVQTEMICLCEPTTLSCPPFFEANTRCSCGLINELKHYRWLPQWWKGRRWQQSFFWWFCTWWWELLSSGRWSSLTRGRKQILLGPVFKALSWVLWLMRHSSVPPEKLYTFLKPNSYR